MTRTTAQVSDHLDPLERTIRNNLLKALTSREPSDMERDLLGLPARHGGLGLPNPVKEAGASYEAAFKTVEPIVEHITRRKSCTLDETLSEQSTRIAQERRKRTTRVTECAKELFERLDPRSKRAMRLAQERGASSWLTALPLSTHGFVLSKGEFHDALCLRYGWQPARLPSHCTDGQPFTVDHALSCARGGYVSLRHNEIRDLLGELLSETCKNVATEPMLQPLSGEQFSSRSAVKDEGARLDIRANGFWGTAFESAFFDVRVFNPYARSYRSLTMEQLYRRQEREKCLCYEERVREVERGTFTPLVFACSGGAGPASTVFLKRLASMLADKHDMPYSQAIGWLRCRVSFALLRACILCVRGSRPPSSSTKNTVEPAAAVAESHLDY